MISILVAVIKAIITKLLTTSALSFLHPHLLKLDAWCEDKLGIDLIKQDQKFHEKYPLVAKRIEKLEEWTHPPVAPGGATELDSRISELERRLKIKK